MIKSQGLNQRNIIMNTKKHLFRFNVWIIPFLITSTMLCSQSLEEAQVGNDLPAFYADLPNPNDFGLFANGGWDGSWYVGFNTCWMQKVSVQSEGQYRRAFLGAKLGRMKYFPEKPPWDKKAYPGKIYMSISSTPSWTRAQSYFLVSTEDIPLESDGENAIEGAGESRWFWAEIPLKLVNPRGDNYLALWSPSQNLTNLSSAPILAAGWGTKEVNSWVTHEAKGMAPTDPAKSISTPLTVFEPAIALKLVPESSAAKPRIKIKKIENGKARANLPAPRVVWSSIEGESIERSWVEISTDSKNWNRYGRYMYSSPFTFTVKMHEIPIGPEGKTWIRIGAADIYENVGLSDATNLFEHQ